MWANLHPLGQPKTVRAAQEDLLLGRHLHGVRRWGQNGTAIAPQPTCENIAATVTQDNVKQHQCVPEDAAPADPAWAKCEIEGCCYTFAAALNRSVCLKRSQSLAQGYVRTAVQLITLHGTQVSARPGRRCHPTLPLAVVAAIPSGFAQ